MIAERGLPVAPEEQTEPLMAGDRAPVVTVPLTDGFARTGYEQQYMETLEQQRMRGEKPGEQAALGGESLTVDPIRPLAAVERHACPIMSSRTERNGVEGSSSLQLRSVINSAGGQRSVREPPRAAIP